MRRLLIGAVSLLLLGVAAAQADDFTLSPAIKARAAAGKTPTFGCVAASKLPPRN